MLDGLKVLKEKHKTEQNNNYYYDNKFKEKSRFTKKINK